MYLVHVPIILILGLLWSKFAKPGILDNMLALSLMLSAVFAASIVCYKVIEQPLRRRRHSFDITKFFFRNTQ
jgi:peptidoglycan/LPS O-acetylase OafA/YrhL